MLGKGLQEYQLACTAAQIAVAIVAESLRPAVKRGRFRRQ